MLVPVDQARLPGDGREQPLRGGDPGFGNFLGHGTARLREYPENASGLYLKNDPTGSNGSPVAAHFAPIGAELQRMFDRGREFPPGQNQL